eukprot:scaffold211800_cov41-Tisochrysis_lutea.AAC.5
MSTSSHIYIAKHRRKSSASTTSAVVVADVRTCEAKMAERATMEGLLRTRASCLRFESLSEFQMHTHTMYYSLEYISSDKWKQGAAVLGILALELLAVPLMVVERTRSRVAESKQSKGHATDV